MEARLPIDIIVPTPHQQYETVEQHTEDVLNRFHSMFSQIKAENEATFRRNSRLYSGNIHDYKVGDRVFYYTGRKLKNKPRKITFGWLGPYKLVRKVSDLIWVLAPCDKEGDEVLVHVTRIRPFYGPRETGRAVFPGVKDIEDLGDELAEELTSPVVWVNPMDEFHHVPARWEAPEAVIRDIPRKKPTKDAASSTDGTQNGARKKVRIQVPQPADKRDRTDDSSGSDEPDRSKPRPTREGEKRKSDSELGPSEKRIHHRVDKREREKESDPEKQSSLRSKISKLLTPSDDSTMESEQDTSLPTSEEESDNVQVVETDEPNDMRIRSSGKVTIPAGGVMPVKLKLSGKVPGDCWMLVMSRPALARKGIMVDSMTVRQGFEGEMVAVVRNEGRTDVRIEKGQRLAQSMLVPVCDPSATASRAATFAREPD